MKLFSQVQDAIPQWPIGQVRNILGEAMMNNFGLEIDSVFESIEEKALGSASIGQVHSAVLTGDFGGSSVAVKVCKGYEVVR